MMTNIESVLYTGESGATKWFSVMIWGVMIWGGMIGNELIGSFRVPKELKLSADTYRLFLKSSIEPYM